MHGAIPPSIVVEAILIMAWKCLILASPLIVLAVLWWLANRTDQIVHYIYPDLQWEHSLGWLNMRAERRADTAMRWCGYAIYFLLIDALYGIAWGAEGLQQIDNWSDPWVMGELALRVPTLCFCLGIWLLYLGLYLLPKLRAQREEAEFQKFRAEAEETERERNRYLPRAHSRVKSPLVKPRINAPLAMKAPLAPQRMRSKRPPGE
jgi:hypothetical protein